MKITVETTVNALPERVWSAWTTPDDIIRWNFASDDWHCPRADIDLREGGKFSYRMESKDQSFGFEFEGVFLSIDPGREIRFDLGDGREVIVGFYVSENGVDVVETFEAENEMSGEQQRQGWQSILNNFKAHVEASGI